MGLQEKIVRSCNNCKRKTKDIFLDKLELENGIITERAHTANNVDYGKMNQPRKIVGILRSYKNKIKLLKSSKELKGSSIYIK